MPEVETQQLFISYAHEDHEWMEAIRTELGRQQDFTVEDWVDVDHLEPGDDWREEIASAIGETSHALLLVSQAFVESEFINEQELPKLTERAKRLIPVPIGDVELAAIGLDGLQAALDPAKPLRPTPAEYRNDSERDEAVRELVRNIRRGIDPILSKLEDILDTEKYRVRWRMCENAATNLYFAEQHDGTGRKVVIKALHADRGRRGFYEGLDPIAKITASANIVSLYDAQSQRDPPYYVMQHIDGRSLLDYVHETGMLDCDFVGRTLLKLGEAVRRIRTSGGLANFYFDIRPSHVMIQLSDLEPYLSFNGRDIALRGDEGIDRIEARAAADDEEAGVYIVPEHFGAWPHRVPPDQSDQYLLGLLGYYMLAARHPRRVAEPAALDQPDAWAAFGELEPLGGDKGIRGRFEDLTPIIERMVAVDPELRFSSLDASLRALRNPPLYTLQAVRDSYMRCVRTEALADEFIGSFYERFFQKCPEAKAKFEPWSETRWATQRRQLKHGVLLLFVYFEQEARNASPDQDRIVWDHSILGDTNVLSYTAAQHRDLAIEPDWFESFIEALAEAAGESDPYLVEARLNLASARSYDEKLLRDQWLRVLEPGASMMKRTVLISR